MCGTCALVPTMYIIIYFERNKNGELPKFCGDGTRWTAAQNKFSSKQHSVSLVTVRINIE